MSEAEWWGATEPVKLADWLFFDALAADRKSRLFSLACCEPLRELVADREAHAALDLAESFVEGRIDETAFQEGCRPLWRDFHRRNNLPGAVTSDRIWNAECACLNTTIPDVPRDRNMHSDLYPYAP